jgi:hypothetical protein
MSIKVILIVSDFTQVKVAKMILQVKDEHFGA